MEFFPSKGKTRIIAKFLWTDLVICSHSREGKNPSYSQINTVIADVTMYFGRATLFREAKNKSQNLFCSVRMAEKQGCMLMHVQHFYFIDM